MIKARKLIMRSSYRAGAVLLSVMIASLSLGACSSTPDWANPVEWYKGTRDWVTGEEPKEAKSSAQAEKPFPGDDKAYPKLSSVPERPAAPSESERQAMVKSLAADRESARYTDQQIRLQSESVTKSDIVARPPARVEVATPSPAVRSVAAPPPVQTARLPAAPEMPPAAASIPSVAPSMNANPPPAVDSSMAMTAPSPRQAMFNSMPAESLQAPTRGGFVPAKRFSTRFPAGVGGMVTPPAPVSDVASPAEALATVFFKSGSSSVTASERGKIRRAVDAVKGSNARVVVIGHASSRTRNLDPLRHQLANFRISYDRAEAVAKELVRLGIERNSIEISAMSDAEPVYYEVMPAGEARNRRVEIVLAN